MSTPLTPRIAPLKLQGTDAGTRRLLERLTSIRFRATFRYARRKAGHAWVGQRQRSDFFC